MSKLVTVKYDAAQNSVRLAEPQDGGHDDAPLQVQVTAAPKKRVVDPQRPWLALRGSLSQEAGEELAAAIEELFPPWND
jgi:hypothetical protein